MDGCKDPVPPYLRPPHMPMPKVCLCLGMPAKTQQCKIKRTGIIDDAADR